MQLLTQFPCAPGTPTTPRRHLRSHLAGHRPQGWPPLPPRSPSRAAAPFQPFPSAHLGHPLPRSPLVTGHTGTGAATCLRCAGVTHGQRDEPLILRTPGRAGAPPDPALPSTNSERWRTVRARLSPRRLQGRGVLRPPATAELPRGRARVQPCGRCAGTRLQGRFHGAEQAEGLFQPL